MSANNYLHRHIGNYRLITLLGSGGFGSVYRGEHTILSGCVAAIKILHTYLDSVEERNQFIQEAQLLANMQHPHILHIFDVGVDNGIPYLVAEYAPNGSLRNLIKQFAPKILPIETSLSIISQIGQALEYAHQQNVIHRDLKPENILFNAQGDVLLADFGVATQLTTSSVKQVTINGTPSYMAPESFQGAVCKESDQYSLACIAYELLTGQTPFTAPDFFSMGFVHLTEPVIALTQHNPAIPQYIEAAILKAMAKKREDRHANIRAFVAALNNFSVSDNSSFPTRLATSASAALPVYVSTPPHAQLPDTHLPTQTIFSDADLPDRTHMTPPNVHGTPSRYEPVTPLPATAPFRQVGRDEHSSMLTQPSQFALRSHESSGSRYIQEPVTPFHTQLANGWQQNGGQNGVWQSLPPDVGGWNEDVAYSGRKQASNRKWKLATITSVVIAIAIVASLLFAFLPAMLSPRTITKTVYLSIHATATSVATVKKTAIKTTVRATATTTTVKTNGGPLVYPTATISTTGGVTPQPTSVPTQNPIAIPTTAPTATPVPTATTAPTPTPTPNPTPSPTPILNSETIQVYFANATSNGWGTSTQYSYSGTVKITISGTGQASSTQWSDAFYIYTDSSGNLLSTPVTAKCWTLYINGATADSSVGLPSYNSSHAYTVYMTLSQASSINFGVCDGQTSDNTGSYSITVQQQ